MKRSITILLCMLTFSLSQSQTSDKEGVEKAEAEEVVKTLTDAGAAAELK